MYRNQRKEEQKNSPLEQEAAKFFEFEKEKKDEREIILEGIIEGKNKLFNKIKKFIIDQIQPGEELISFTYTIETSEWYQTDVLERSILFELLNKNNLYYVELVQKPLDLQWQGITLNFTKLDSMRGRRSKR